MPENVDYRDPLYLFACHLGWRNSKNVAAYQELLAALDDPSEKIRTVAEVLLHRSAPRPEPSERSVQALVKQQTGFPE